MRIAAPAAVVWRERGSDGTRAGGRVFMSADKGTSWKPVNDGLPDYSWFSLSDFALSGQDVFLGSFKGVFVFSEHYDSWTTASSGLSEKTSLYAHAMSETNLFAGTEGGEVWRLPLTTVSRRRNTLAPDGYDQSQYEVANQEHDRASKPPAASDDINAMEFRQNILLAEQGDAIAQFKVGYAYHFGHGVAQDDAESFRWMRLAAEHGVAEAQMNVGQYYEHGFGVVQDFDEAKEMVPQSGRAGAAGGTVFSRPNVR